MRKWTDDKTDFFLQQAPEIPLSEIKNQLQAFGAEEILADPIV